MQVFNNVFTLIDMRSFSNLWYWIALAVMWSTTAHYILGVPFDMVVRARRGAEQERADLDLMVHVQVRRRLRLIRMAGPWLVGLSSAALTMLCLLGFVYRIEFAQALFLMGLPLSLVALMNLATARRIEAGALTGAVLHNALTRQRFRIQVLGLISIFFTALWGMWQNMNMSLLGG